MDKYIKAIIGIFFMSIFLAIIPINGKCVWADTPTPKAVLCEITPAGVTDDENRSYKMTFYYDTTDYSQNPPAGFVIQYTGDTDGTFPKYEYNSVYAENVPEWFNKYINSGTVKYCSKTNIVEFDSSFSNYRPQNMQYWFLGFAVHDFTNMQYLNSSEVKNMKGTFRDCDQLRSVNWTGNLNTGKVINMEEMFSSIRLRNAGGSNIDFELDVSSFDTRNVTNMKGMFRTNDHLTGIKFSKSFLTSKVTTMERMFGNCTVIESLDLSGFDTHNVTNMKEMFNSCNRLNTIDLSSFDTSNVTNMEKMFCMNTANQSQLNTIYVSNRWKTNKVTSDSEMFYGVTYLTGEKGTNFDTEKTAGESAGNTNYMSKLYAHIDGGPSNPGYFTGKNLPDNSKNNGREIGNLPHDWMQGLYDFLKNYGISESEEADSGNNKDTDLEVMPDRDTYKSSLDPKTVVIGDITSNTGFLEMKAHEMSATDAANQDFLISQSLAAKGKNYKIITRYDIYPNRNLTTAEDGKLQTLSWNKLTGTTPGTIFALCYNGKDPAYILTGIVDAKGTAKFSNFLLREFTSVTIFTVY